MAEDDYKMTEEDILAMLKYLRLNLPEHATPEKAVFLLTQQKAHIENLEALHSDVIDEMLKDFEKH
jgi:hypothetical protein